MKVTFCTLFLGDRPHPAFMKSLEECLPVIEAYGWEHGLAQEQNCPYISAARAKVLRKALDAESDVIVFLDYDMSWAPMDMLKLLEADGDVVAGTYRQKRNDEKYMGSLLPAPGGGFFTREDGALKASKIPAGFLKVTKSAVTRFAKSYPELLFGDPMKPEIDMFNHGAIDGIWYGEDYAFSKRWIDCGGDIWLLPDLDLNHNKGEQCFEGNFHKYLMNYDKEAPIEKAPLVSVIIPCYNYGKYLDDAITSVLAQSYPHLEIIVVDDGSPDDTMYVASRYERIKYFRQHNQGPAAARNNGIRASQGEWIICLDADDKLCPTYVEECLKVADADIITTHVRDFGESTQIRHMEDGASFQDFIVGNCIHSASMFRRSCWEAVGGYDEKMPWFYEDWELWVHMAKLGYEIKLVKKALFLYRKHGKSGVSIATEHHKELHDYILKKHTGGNMAKQQKLFGVEHIEDAEMPKPKKMKLSKKKQVIKPVKASKPKTAVKKPKKVAF